MNDKRGIFYIESRQALKATSDTDKIEKGNNLDYSGEKSSLQKIIVKGSLIFLKEKLKSKFFKYQKCLYICLFVYILDYIVWFISRKHLKDLVNIFSLLFSLILNLVSIYLFKDELNFLSKALYKCINKIITINIISLIIYYINLFLIFGDKIIKAKFDGLLAKIFPNHKGLKMFYGIYLIVNFLFPTLTFIYLSKVKKLAKFLRIAIIEKYKNRKAKRNVKEENYQYDESKTTNKKLKQLKKKIVPIK